MREGDVAGSWMTVTAPFDTDEKARLDRQRAALGHIRDVNDDDGGHDDHPS